MMYTRTQQRRTKFGWEYIDIGESRTFKTTTVKEQGTIRVASHLYGRRHGMTFTTKAGPDRIIVTRVK